MLATLLLAVLMNYTAPAGIWNAALPLGNGRLGAIVFGDPAVERDYRVLENQPKPTYACTGGKCHGGTGLPLVVSR